MKAKLKSVEWIRGYYKRLGIPEHLFSSIPETCQGFYGDFVSRSEYEFRDTLVYKRINDSFAHIGKYFRNENLILINVNGQDFCVPEVCTTSLRKKLDTLI